MTTTRHYRFIGATNKLPDHFIELGDGAGVTATVTGTIRKGLHGYAGMKRDYCYLEIQEVDDDAGDYEVVDSWSGPDERMYQ